MSTRLVGQVGRLAWALLGILALAMVAGFVLKKLALLFIPLVLALFPATLLVPVVQALGNRGLPRTPATFVTLLASLLVFTLLAWGTVTLVIAQVPDLVDSAGEGVSRVEEEVQRAFPGFHMPGVDGALDYVRDRLARTTNERGDTQDDLASGVLSATLGAVQVVAGILLFAVILFFYLRNGRDLVVGTVAFLAPAAGNRLLPLAEEAWDTLGGYFRGQLMVALFDAVLIGIGLLVLGIPLVVPLVALTLIGGLFPIVGAVVAGALAVLVAFAHGGIGLGLGVAAIVLVVQQIESNLLAPLILSRVLDLHPLVIILSVTVGGVVLGVLGAFLAVPAAAIVKQVVTSLRAESEA